MKYISKDEITEKRGWGWLEKYCFRVIPPNERLSTLISVIFSNYLGLISPLRSVVDWGQKNNDNLITPRASRADSNKDRSDNRETQYMHFCDFKSDILVNLQILKDRDVIDRRDYKLKCSSSPPVIHTRETTSRNEPRPGSSSSYFISYPWLGFFSICNFLLIT